MTPEPPPVGLLQDMSVAHRDIRLLLDQLENQPDQRIQIAEALCLALARHQAACTALVVDLATRGHAEHEHRARLLGSASQGINRLVDRLRLPVYDTDHADRLVDALRMLIVEHERLELELALIGLHHSELAPSTSADEEALRRGRLREMHGATSEKARFNADLRRQLDERRDLARRDHESDDNHER